MSLRRCEQTRSPDRRRGAAHPSTTLFSIGSTVTPLPRRNSIAPFTSASGPLSKVPEAYNKLMGALPPMNLKPTTTVREYYLYWETPESPNNIVQIQVGIE